MSETNFHNAAKIGNEAQLREEIRNGVNIDCTDPYGRTALMKACFAQQNTIVDILLEHNANVTLADVDGDTALHDACNQGQQEMAEKLLRAGGQINKRNKARRAPFDLCSESAVAEHLKEVAAELLSNSIAGSAAGSNGIARSASVPYATTPLQQMKRSETLFPSTRSPGDIDPTSSNRFSTKVGAGVDNSSSGKAGSPFDQTWKTKFEELSLDKKAVDDKVQILQSALGDAVNKGAEQAKYLAAVATAEEICRASNDLLNAELRKKSAELLDAQNRVQSLSLDNLTLQENVEELTAQLNAASSEKESIASELGTLRAEKESLELGGSALEEVKQAQSRAEAECRRIQVDFQQAQANWDLERKSFVADADQAKETISALEQELASLRQSQAELDQAKAAATNHEQELASFKLAQETYEADIGSLKTELDMANSTVANFVKEIADLRQTHQAEALDRCTQAPDPFQRYERHLFIDGILPPSAPVGIHTVPHASPLFKYCSRLCNTAGSWRDEWAAVAGFRLVDVQAVKHEEDVYGSFKMQQRRLTNNRKTKLGIFNFDTWEGFTPTQLHVLSLLQNQFHDHAPGSSPLSAKTFYCFHGPRPEHLENIIQNGMVAIRQMDAGFFGAGLYSTFNIEYALRYTRGDFDSPDKPRARPANNRFPVIMFIATIAMAYPITREVDYGGAGPQDKEAHSVYLGRPLKPNFDCHVVCVNKQAGLHQAVGRKECQYVEIVIDQQIQMLPVAVLWFEDITV